MELDWQVCSRARLSRDARFDGKFFIAVLTSRVYCRSICPAPTAKEKNVRYYPSAAAAAEAARFVGGSLGEALRWTGDGVIDAAGKLVAVCVAGRSARPELRPG